MITRYIYPLILREKITWRIKKFFTNINYDNVSLEFNEKLKLDLSKSDVGHQSIKFNGYYELELTKNIIRLGNTGGLLIDVGANYGYFSCLWAAQNINNKVIAFEASPINVQPLINNVKKNGLSDAIIILPFAVGKEIGKLNFDLGDESQQTGWGGFSIVNRKGLVEVEVDTLDDYTFRNNINQIDVLKIDTEGADTWVLYGAERLLKEKKIKHIYFEHNLTRMKLLNISQNEAIDFLKKFDYLIKQQSETDFYAFPN